MKYNWLNKTVIITGSSIGIGWHTGLQLARLGAQVVFNARNAERLNEKIKLLDGMNYQVIGCTGDVTKFEDCKHIVDCAIQHFGKVDVLINNAGLSADGISMEHLNPIVFEQLYRVNVFGSFYMAKAALPYIKTNKGSILFISSVAGTHGFGNYAAYCSSKMALTGLAQSLSKELVDDKVHVGIAYVGFTENDPEKNIINNDGNVIPKIPLTKDHIMPVAKVVSQIIKMIEKRKRSAVLGLLGKFTFFMARWFPRLLHRIMLQMYRKEMKQIPKPFVHAGA